MAEQYVIGVDEVGRGSLAGPVVVGAFLMPTRLRFSDTLGKLKDSKQLTAREREQWFAYFADHPHVHYTVARVYPRTIERINIANAANLAAARAVHRLFMSSKLQVSSSRIYLDGGLYIGSRAAQPAYAKTIVKGDEKINCVKAASIVAKVLRDKMLVKLARKYPQYGFDVHKGYGTKMHLAAIKKFGPSETHRVTFDPIRRLS